MTATADKLPPPEPTNVERLPVTAPPRRSEVRVVNDPIPVLDTARFEHMQRIANVMAHSNLVPDALCKIKEGEGPNAKLVPLDPTEIVSNCFLVVNQAVRWGLDPFAVAQCVSVVHGKLCYEGKLIAAVLTAKLGVKLEYEISGEGEAMKVVVSASINGDPVVDSSGEVKTVEGTVAEWKTTGNGSPWAARGGYPRMLRYRGAREWARVHEPSIMLGVYSPDEMDDLDTRARNSRDVTPRSIEPPDPTEPPEPTTPAAAPVPSEPEPTGPQKQADDLEIPPEFDRRPKPAPMIEAKAVEVFDVEQWLKDLDGAYSGCEDATQLADAVLKYMTPHKDKVSPADFERAGKLSVATFARITGTAPPF